MSQKINITNPLTALIAAALTGDIATIMAIVDLLKISLTESQVIGLLSVSTGKEAIIKAIFTNIMEPYPAMMPTDVSVSDFAAITLEETNTNTLIGLLTPIVTILEQHSAILKNNRMFITTEVLNNAKLAAKKNTALNTAVKLIVTTFYGRTAAKPTALFELGISGKMDLGGVKTGTPLVNTGNATISYVKTNGDISQTIIVYPGSASTIPKGWTNITIINLSGTIIAKFNVFMK